MNRISLSSRVSQRRISRNQRFALSGQLSQAAAHLDYVERTLTTLNRKAVRSRKANQQLQLTIPNVKILSGRALTHLRRAKQILDFPLAYERHTARPPRPKHHATTKTT